MPMVGVPGGRTDRISDEWRKGGWVLLYQSTWEPVPGSPVFSTEREGETWRDFNKVTEPTTLEFRQR